MEIFNGKFGGKMYGNDFNGSAAFSGGGFMPAAATQAPDASPLTSSKNTDARCVLPLTVKQLKDLSKGGESSAAIDGLDVNNIVLVGRVIKIESGVTEFTFKVDDGTGWVDCTRWVNEQVDSAEVEAISVGMYAHVFGQLKSIQTRRTLLTFSIRPVIDFDEIAAHFIECICVHIHNTNKLRAGSSTQSQMPTSTTSFSTPMKSYQANQPNQFQGHGDNELTEGIGRMVINFLKQPMCLASNTGVSCDIIARELRISSEKIREILEYYATEGIVYSTTEDSYKYIDC